MKLRATAAFPDSVPPAVQEWDDALTDVDSASRWLDAMARLTAARDLARQVLRG